MELWEVLSNRRKEIGMSFDELHNKTNLSISTLKKILGGHVSAPSFESIRAISYAMDTTLAEIDHRIALLDRNRDCESDRTIASSMLRPDGISNAAMALAILFDKLDEHGQEIVMAVARIEFNRIDLDNISKGVDITGIIGVQPISNIRMHKVPLVGTAFCDGSGEMRYAAKEELREMEAEEIKTAPHQTET